MQCKRQRKLKNNIDEPSFMDYNVAGLIRAEPYKRSGKCKVSQTLF